jgi:subtilase family serine protease
MKKFLFLVLVILASAGFVNAQMKGHVIIPDSSIARPGDAGIRAHTNHLIFVPDGGDASAPQGETPASLGCIYGLVSSPLPGCPKTTSTSNPSGGSGLIVIVDAFDYASAASDIATFSSTFGLPAPKFHVMFASGKPTPDCGWNQEAALDIEWSHAMAPNAVIVLMEAKTNSLNDLLVAVDKANSLIAAHGGKGEVSMSWQSGEFSSETSSDSHFTSSNVVYFASSGDSGGVVGWPSTSVNVVSAGGTTVHRDSNGNFSSEIAWAGSGGGDSAFELRPTFQDAIQSIVGTHRGTPDFSYDADPNSGVSVYETSPACGGNDKWLVFGGTSVSSPSLAGVVNSTKSFNASSQAENTEIYGNIGNTSEFTDIKAGVCGSHTSVAGWDFCTGVGTDKGKAGK